MQDAAGDLGKALDDGVACRSRDRHQPSVGDVILMALMGRLVESSCGNEQGEGGVVLQCGWRSQRIHMDGEKRNVKRRQRLLFCSLLQIPLSVFLPYLLPSSPLVSQHSPRISIQIATSGLWAFAYHPGVRLI